MPLKLDEQVNMKHVQLKKNWIRTLAWGNKKELKNIKNYIYKVWKWINIWRKEVLHKKSVAQECKKEENGFLRWEIIEISIYIMFYYNARRDNIVTIVQNIVVLLCFS